MYSLDWGVARWGGGGGGGAAWNQFITVLKFCSPCPCKYTLNEMVM